VTDPRLEERARSLRDAARALREVLADPELPDPSPAIAAREVAHRELLEAAEGGLSEQAAGLIREVLALDADAQREAEARKSLVSDELARIRHARTVATRLGAGEGPPRFVSRRV